MAMKERILMQSNIDPIEAGAIADAFSHARSADSPLYLGTIKSNIGHLEGTSGLASLIKSVLMLEHRMIPGIAGLENVNHSIAAEHPHLKVFSLIDTVSGRTKTYSTIFSFQKTSYHGHQMAYVVCQSTHSDLEAQMPT